MITHRAYVYWASLQKCHLQLRSCCAFRFTLCLIYAGLHPVRCYEECTFEIYISRLTEAIRHPWLISVTYWHEIYYRILLFAGWFTYLQDIYYPIPLFASWFMWFACLIIAMQCVGRDQLDKRLVNYIDLYDIIYSWWLYHLRLRYLPLKHRRRCVYQRWHKRDM